MLVGRPVRFVVVVAYWRADWKDVRTHTDAVYNKVSCPHQETNPSSPAVKSVTVLTELLHFLTVAKCSLSLRDV